jgi:peptide-methionine (S)-S-oxide reductase
MNEESIVLGGGCFWCLEALYQRVRGVNKVISGFAGGNTQNPTYDEMHDPNTTHAQTVKVTYDATHISLDTILEIFWAMHDPTTRNQQDFDIGPGYRSIILFKDEAQKKSIDNSLETVAKRLWQKPITTEIKQLDVFWPAEDYHQDWFNKHPEQAYCQIIINPKVIKLKKKFADLLKD